MIQKKGKEKNIERALREGTKKRGGLAIKLPAVYMAGLPDRLVLFPNGHLWFVELKSEGKKQTPLQVLMQRRLEALGFVVFVIDTPERLTNFFESVDCL